MNDDELSTVLDEETLERVDTLARKLGLPRRCMLARLVRAGIAAHGEEGTAPAEPDPCCQVGGSR